MQKILRLVSRFVFWVAVVVVALNIENVAAALGYDKILADLSTSEIGFLSAATNFLTSDMTLYTALFFMGIGTFAWLDHLAKKWDRRHPTLREQRQNIWSELADLADRLSLAQGRTMVPADLFSELVSKYTTMRNLGFHAPYIDKVDPRVFFDAHAVFLNLIWPQLRDGHIEFAVSESEKWAKFSVPDNAPDNADKNFLEV